MTQNHPVVELLHGIEGYFHVSPDAPTWQRALLLYFTLTILWAILAGLLYQLLLRTDIFVERCLRTVARGAPERTAERLAAVNVRVDAALLAGRLLTGVTLIYDSPSEEDTFVRFIRLRWRFLLAAVGAFVLFIVELTQVAIRRTVPNALIWIAVGWYLGWLDSVAKRLSMFHWRSIQPSQLAAVLGLVVIVWAVVARSDIRGRVEFGKVASVEGRKRLLRIRPHLRHLISAASDVRKDVATRLEDFPSMEELEYLTGHHGLDWDKRGVVVSKSCHDHDKHPNLYTGQRGDHWTRRMGDFPRASSGQDTTEAADEQTNRHYDAVQQEVRELKELGYYPKVAEILRVSARAALFDIEFGSKWYPGLRESASKRVTSILQFTRGQKYEISGLWAEAKHPRDLEEARAVTEKYVRKAVREVRDYLWYGYVTSARLQALLTAIPRRQRERLIDRLK